MPMHIHMQAKYTGRLPRESAILEYTTLPIAPPTPLMVIASSANQALSHTKSNCNAERLSFNYKTCTIRAV